MSYILSLIAAVVVLGILIMAHELGHYTAGRLLKLPVIEFAMGMGPKLISVVRGTIRYSIRLLPIGGFCSFNGEDDREAGTGKTEEALNWRDVPLEQRSLNDCPAWRRLVMQFSGVAMNFFVAYLCAVILLCAVGLPESLTRIAEVGEGGPAHVAGMQQGDFIISVNGQDGADIGAVIAQDPEGVLEIVVERNGEFIPLTVTPEYFADTESVRIGVTIGIRYRPVSVGEAVLSGAGLCVEITRSMVDAIGGMIRGQGVDDVMGVVGTVGYMADQTNSYFNDSIRSGMFMLLQLAILLSLNLGIVNLLPLPALDGGRIVFTLIEIIFRKPVPRRAEAWIHTAGFILLMGLVAVLFFKDIITLVNRGSV